MLLSTHFAASNLYWLFSPFPRRPLDPVVLPLPAPRGLLRPCPTATRQTGPALTAGRTSFSQGLRSGCKFLAKLLLLKQRPEGIHSLLLPPLFSEADISLAEHLGLPSALPDGPSSDLLRNRLGKKQDPHFC